MKRGAILSRLHLRGFSRHVARQSRHAARYLWYASAALLALFAILLTAGRLLLPMLADKKPEIENYLSRKSSYQIRIERLGTFWDGLNPGLHVEGLKVFTRDSAQPAIRLADVRISLAIIPLLWGDIEINSLAVTKPSLSLERLRDGRFRVTGFDPLRPPEQARGENVAGWLFKQKRLEIRDGELQWFDRKAGGEALYLRHANISLRNQGSRHRLSVSAEFPPGLCRACSLSLDIDGNPLAAQEWRGEIYLRAADLNLDSLPLVLRERLPEALAGKFDAELWSTWASSRPRSVRGHVAVFDLKLPLAALKQPLQIRRGSADVNWEARDGYMRLDLASLELGLKRPSWTAGHLRIVHRARTSLIQVRHLNLDDLTALARDIKETHEALAVWSKLEPGGEINNLSVNLDGEWDKPTDVTLKADIARLSVRPYRKFPGIEGLSGQLTVRNRSGVLRIDSADGALNMPRVFRSPLKFSRASGTISWEKRSDYWQVAGSDLAVAGEDGAGSGRMMLRVPFDRSVAPFLDLRVDFHDGNGAHAARYYPARRLPAKTLAWMDRAFIGGRITKGYLIYQGTVNQWPFDEGAGRFEIRGHVTNGSYAYLPGWRPITQAEADVLIKGSDVLVTGSGKLGELDVSQVVVQAQRKRPVVQGGPRADVHPKRHYIVRVTGKVAGPVNEALQILRGVKPDREVPKWKAFIPPRLHATGSGALNLDLTVSPHEPKTTTIKGEYRVVDGDIGLSGSPLRADRVSGQVQFTEAGIAAGRLQGRMLGGDTTLRITPREADRLHLEAQGHITAGAVAQFFGPGFAPHVSGAVGWRGTGDFEKGIGRFYAESDPLTGIKSDLPPPLNRPQGMLSEKLVIKTLTASRSRQVLALQAGAEVSGQLAFGHQDDRWRFIGGYIGFGGNWAASPDNGGFVVSANIEALDVDQWLRLLESRARDVAPDFVKRVVAEVGALAMFDRDFGKMSVDFRRQKAGWSGTLSGPAAAGTARFDKRGATRRITLDLTKLKLPEGTHKGRVSDLDPGTLPIVAMHVDAFEMNGKQVGELGLQAAPEAHAWQIRRLTLKRPEMETSVSGRWVLRRGRHSSRFDVVFRSSDLGKTMESLGSPDQLAGGEAEVTAHLTWPAPPADVRLGILNGNVVIRAERGRFLQAKQGAARLFGLLDLSAIRRYLVLDFSPVFGKGFVYDRIRGTIEIDEGNAYTRNLTIKGPSAAISVNGRIGLAQEDFDLLLEVSPQLSDALTLTSWGLWGPQIAAVVLALQKIFKKQITKGTRVTYMVKGSWEDPTVTRLLKEGTANEESGETRLGE